MIGENLNLVRRFCELSQENLAEIFNVSREMIKKYEKGFIGDPVRFARKLELLAKRYEIPITDFLIDSSADIKAIGQ